MTGIIVDPRPEYAQRLRLLCAAVGGLDVVGSFSDASDAVAFAGVRQTDVVLCTWEVPGMERTAFSRALHTAAPGAALIYTADTEVRADHAFEAGAGGCLIEPVVQDKLSACLARLRASGPVREEQKQVRVRTFGHFDLYVDGVVVVFRNSRAKELLALLVDSQGGTVTMDRIIEAFWPDEPYSEQHKALYRKASLALKNTLAEYAVGHILLSSRNQKAVIPGALDCDYYRFLAGDREAAAQFHGEYMTDYSWAEETNSRLWRLARRRGDIF